jgi:hypothetical protein
VPLTEELARVAEAAGRFATAGEEVAAVIPAEPEPGLRVYVCAYGADEHRTWLALGADGRPLHSRAVVRAAVSIAALCEIAEEVAGGGDLDDLLARLEELRRTDAPEGVEEATRAALELRETLGVSPRLASPAYLDTVGAATRRLEEALGNAPRSPLSEALRQSTGTVEELASDVEARYKLDLE